MIGKEKIFEVLHLALERAEGPTELLFLGGRSELTRFTRSQIHQHVAEEDTSIYVKAVEGKRIGVARTNRLSVDAIVAAERRAREMARYLPENPHFPGLLGPQEYTPTETYCETTPKFGPDKRAEVLAGIFAVAGERKFEVAGSFSVSEWEVALANTEGLEAYQPVTGAEIGLVVTSGEGMARADAFSPDVERIDFMALADKAISRCALDRDKIELPPGEYTVILEPACLAEIFGWLSFTAFGSEAYLSGQSFLAGAIGERSMGENVTIYDSAWEPEVQGLPFDLEGTPKRKVVLIERGVNRGVVFDRVSAAKAKAEPTGHAGPPGSPWGAIPWNLCMAPGDSSLEEMIASCKRGILVSNFHYVNGYLNTKRALMTGMTRYGTFLVENGEITRALANLRWTESMLRAFSNVVAISKEREVFTRGGAFTTVVPAVMIEGFTFTGVQRE
ncbi:TldD/PmbA family protein [Candidatus Bipolaricaulota sp. J31]